jgi:hypothetical protein
MGKDPFAAYLEVTHYLAYFLWRPKKAKKILGQGRWSLGLDLNLRLP